MEESILSNGATREWGEKKRRRRRESRGILERRMEARTMERGVYRKYLFFRGYCVYIGDEGREGIRNV